jgi:hypothetical protein
MNTAIAITTLVLMEDRFDLSLHLKVRLSLTTGIKVIVINTSGHLGDSQDD